MVKKRVVVSGAALVAALERVCAIMKGEVKKDPEMVYVVATVGSGTKVVPSLAVVFRFEPETMRHTDTKICSEKRAAKAWNKAHGIKVQ
jgi:hypothetical protein